MNDLKVSWKIATDGQNLHSISFVTVQNSY